MRLQVVEHQLAHGVPGLPGGARLCGCRTTLSSPSRASGTFGSAATIQPGSAEPAGDQRLDQGRLLDHRAARDVDQPGLGPSASITSRLTSPAVVGPPRQVTIRQSTAAAISTRSGKYS